MDEYADLNQAMTRVLATCSDRLRRDALATERAELADTQTRIATRLAQIDAQLAALTDTLFSGEVA